jgi:signal transduction histidine kinase/ligand-binding sensor domain-containing protein
MILKLLIHFTLIFTFAFYSSFLSAQNAKDLTGLKFRQITMEDGLPSNRVYKVTEDKFGFTWVATSNGLCRYDGLKVKNFSDYLDDSLKLSQAHVRTVFTDSKGHIWVGFLTEGLCMYDYATGKFTKYRNEPNNPHSLVNNEILSIFEDSKQQIWVGTEHGVSIFNHSTKKFTSYTNNLNDPSSIGAGAVLNIAEDAKNRIWLTTWAGGLNLFLPNTDGKGSFRSFHPFDCKHFWSLYLDSQERFWVGSFDGGLLLMKTDDNQALEKLEPQFINFRKDPKKPHNISNNIVFEIKEDNEGKIWLATAHGLNLFDPTTLLPQTMSLDVLQNKQKEIAFKHYNYEYNNHLGLPSHEILGLTKTKNGTLWACTSSGIATYNPNKHSFQARYLPKCDLFDFMNLSSVVQETNGRTWYGSQGCGLYVYEPKTQIYKEFSQIGSHATAQILGTYIYKLYLENDKFLWLSCDNGLVRMNLMDYSCKTVISNLDIPQAIRTAIMEARVIFKDQKDNLWFGTRTGLFRYNAKTNQKDFWCNKPNDLNSLSHNLITGIVEDEKGDIWVALHKGVDKFSFDENGKVVSIKNYSHNPSDPYSISSNRTTSICQKNGYLYIGTEMGLSRTNGDGKFTTFGRDNARGDFFIRGLIEGEGNFIWGSTSIGLFRFDTKSEDFEFFDKEDGLHDNFFSLGAAYKTPKNELFFCGRLGATSFFEKDIIADSTHSTIYLTNVRVNNKITNMGTDAALIKYIQLKYTDNNISFEFTALNFTKPKLLRYAYKMEGYDEDWIFAGNQNMAVYTNLSGGDYTFKVKSSDENGQWDESTLLVIPVHIAKPFWEETWFHIFCLICLSLGVYLIILYRTRVVLEKNKSLRKYNITLNKEIAERKKAEELLVKVNEELNRSNNDLEQFAYIASHDLQEPLRTIGNFMQLLNRRYANVLDENAKQYIHFAVDGSKRMSILIQSLLKFSKVGRNDVEMLPISIHNVVENKIMDLKTVIDEKKAEIILQELPSKIICEPNQLGMVFYNLINNAMKFNKNETPKVFVKCKDMSDTWLFSIEDNGIGIKPEYQDMVFEIFKRLHSRDEYEGHGIGLALCKRIVYRHGGKIWFESEYGKGTTFFFTVSKNLEASGIAATEQAKAAASKQQLEPVE